MEYREAQLLMDEAVSQAVSGPTAARELLISTANGTKKVLSRLNGSEVPPPDIVGLGCLGWGNRYRLRIMLSGQQMCVRITDKGIDLDSPEDDTVFSFTDLKEVCLLMKGLLSKE